MFNSNSSFKASFNHGSILDQMSEQTSSPSQKELMLVVMLSKNNIDSQWETLHWLCHSITKSLYFPLCPCHNYYSCKHWTLTDLDWHHSRDQCKSTRTSAFLSMKLPSRVIVTMITSFWNSVHVNVQVVIKTKKHFLKASRYLPWHFYAFIGDLTVEIWNETEEEMGNDM